MCIRDRRSAERSAAASSRPRMAGRASAGRPCCSRSVAVTSSPSKSVAQVAVAGATVASPPKSTSTNGRAS
eukprot:9717213-Alexandrium_andersonii.AAC.1